jgi:hypothetical protein
MSRKKIYDRSTVTAKPPMTADTGKNDFDRSPVDLPVSSGR